MPTAKSILAELKKKGSEKTRATYARHGMPADRVFGVSVADLKVIAKTIKGQQELACELYSTGFMDAMYLAGMVADGREFLAEGWWVSTLPGLAILIVVLAINLAGQGAREAFDPRLHR